MWFIFWSPRIQPWENLWVQIWSTSSGWPSRGGSGKSWSENWEQSLDQPNSTWHIHHESKEIFHMWTEFHYKTNQIFCCYLTSINGHAFCSWWSLHCTSTVASGPERLSVRPASSPQLWLLSCWHPLSLNIPTVWWVKYLHPLASLQVF